MNRKTGVLCVFSKTPVAGQVKTRLLPVLGRERTTALYLDLLKRTLATACAANVDVVRLHCTPTTEHPVLKNCAHDFAVNLYLQQGEDLGEKMCRALNEGLEEFDYALVVGCDCPALQPEDLNRASEALISGKDAVLGPASDGGYYLLGLTSPQNGLFEQMPWGGSAVLAETKRRLSASSMDWLELPTYTDIDGPEDLGVYEKLKSGVA